MRTAARRVFPPTVIFAAVIRKAVSPGRLLELASAHELGGCTWNTLTVRIEHGCHTWVPQVALTHWLVAAAASWVHVSLYDFSAREL